jgi:hypothetical protein
MEQGNQHKVIFLNDSEEDFAREYMRATEDEDESLEDTMDYLQRVYWFEANTIWFDGCELMQFDLQRGTLFCRLPDNDEDDEEYITQDRDLLIKLMHEFCNNVNWTRLGSNAGMLRTGEEVTQQPMGYCILERCGYVNAIWQHDSHLGLCDLPTTS